MPGRVLIVDDSATNRILMRARLGTAYYEVIEAGDGEQAMALATDDPPDIVLLDLRLPGIGGFEICRRLKSQPATQHVPVIMVTASDGREDRLHGLEAGADDFLTKPFDELALVSRIASLTRMKMLVDELALRGGIAAQGMAGTAGMSMTDAADLTATTFPDARILIVSSRAGARRLGAAIGPAVGSTIALATPLNAMRMRDDTTPPDAVLIDGRLAGADPLHLGARLRARPASRRAALLLIVPPDDGGKGDRGKGDGGNAGGRTMAARALEIGFDDYVASPVDHAELIARLRLQLRRKGYADRLRATMRDSMVHAITDPLTGLYNRRHANTHLDNVVDRCRDRGAELAMMLLDLDRFKAINDRHGHAAGDMVLHEFARRLRATVRSIDMVARIGGEEFMVVMPDAGAAPAAEIAERVRHATADFPFRISGDGATRRVTVSIGYAALRPRETSLELIARADRALYASKRAGRNRATLGRSV